MSVAVCVRGTRSAAERWSFAAFLLAAIGLALSIWFIVGSETDTSQVRWWLVFAPLVITAAPVVFSRQSVRVSALITLGAWCVVAIFSIGMLQLPALVVSVISAARDRS